MAHIPKQKDVLFEKELQKINENVVSRCLLTKHAFAYSYEFWKFYASSLCSN